LNLKKQKQFLSYYPLKQGLKRIDINGKYYLPIHPDYMAYFAGCTIVETVEYPQEVEDDN